MALGFLRVQVDSALRAAYYNPDRAAEYLFGRGEAPPASTASS